MTGYLDEPDLTAMSTQDAALEISSLAGLPMEDEEEEEAGA